MKFEQLQMKVGLDEEPELKISRFIKGLSPSIANKVDLRTYLSYNDVCHLAIKVEKQFKDRKPVQTASIRPQGTLTGYSSHNKFDTTPIPIKALNKGKGIASESPKRLRVRSASNAIGMDTF